MNDATAGSNVKARKKQLREFVERFDKIDAEKAKLAEDRKALTKEFKDAELGVTLSNFHTMRRLSTLDNEARGLLFDTLREGFEALGITWPA